MISTFSLVVWCSNSSSQSTCWMEVAAVSSVAINLSEVIPSGTNSWSDTLNSSKISVRFASGSTSVLGWILLTLTWNPRLCKAIDDGYIRWCLPWLLKHNHCIQYRDVWQFFVAVNSVDVLADHFDTMFSFKRLYNTLNHRCVTEVLFGGKKVRSMPINPGTSGTPYFSPTNDLGCPFSISFYVLNLSSVEILCFCCDWGIFPPLF